MKSKQETAYQFETQVQQQKVTAVSIMTVVRANSVPLTAFNVWQSFSESQQASVYLAFCDVNGNVKLAESGPAINRSVLLNSFKSKPQTNPYTMLCAHPSKNYLALGDYSGKIEFMRISSKSDNVQTFKLHLSRINWISFCDSTERMISASNDKTVKVYDVSSVLSAKKHPIFIQSFSLQSFALKAEILNQSHLLTLELKALRLFDVETKSQIFSYEAMPKEKLIDFHLLSSSCVCLVSEDATFRILDLNTQKLERAFTLANRTVRKTRLANEKGVIIAYGKTGVRTGNSKADNGSVLSQGRESIFLINVLDPQINNLVDYEPRSEVTDILISPNASFFAFSTVNDSISIYKQSHGLIPDMASKKLTGLSLRSIAKAKESRKSKALTSSTVVIKKANSSQPTINITTIPPVQVEIERIPIIPTSDDKTPFRTTPLESHNTQNVPLANLLSKNKSESNQPIEFEITNIISSMQKMSVDNDVIEQIQNLSIFLTKIHEPKKPTQDSQISDYSKKLFNSAPYEAFDRSCDTHQNDLTELRTVDYNITETKHGRTEKVSIDYNDIENFIKQREEYIRINETESENVKIEEDFSFKVTYDKHALADPLSSREINGNNRNLISIEVPGNQSMNEPSPSGEDAHEEENPFDQVLGKTFKTRDVPQIVIIDQNSPTNVELV